MDGFGFRSYRTHLLLSGEVTSRGWTEPLSLVRDSKRCDLLPPEFKPHGFMTRATCMLAQAGAVIQDLIAEHKNYPFKLFDLMDTPDDEIRAKLEAIPLCRLDEWSLSLVEAYLSREGRWGADFKAELWHTALQHEFDNAAREAHHASIRRQIVVSSAQTHAEAFQRTNAAFVLRSARRIVHKVSRGTRQRPRQRASFGSRCEGAKEKKKKKKKKKKNPGSGGAWRAFIREATLGQRGRPDLKDLSGAYHALHASELARLRQSGGAATAAAKAGGRAFGLNTRQQQRASRKRTFDEAIAAETGAGSSAVRVAQPRTPGSSAFERELALTGSVSALRSSPWLQLASLKDTLRRERAIELARNRAAEEMSEAYAAGQGRVDVSGISNLVGGGNPKACFAERSADFTSRPGQPLQHRAAMWRPMGVLQRAAKALKLRRKTKAGMKFFSASNAVWNRLSRTTQYREDPKVTALRGKKKVARLCHSAGMCVCGDRGKLLQRLGNNIDIASKKHFGLGRPSRSLLGRANVVYVFVGHTKEQWEDAEDGNSGPITESCCFHISDHSYSPWLSHYQSAKIDKPDDLLWGPPGVACFDLTFQYFNKFFMLDKFDLSLRWS